MDKDYLKILKANSTLKEEKELIKLKMRVAIGLVLTLIVLSVFLTSAIIIILKSPRITKEPSDENLETMSAQVLLSDTNDVDRLTDELKEKDNEIAQLKDRIAFLSFVQAIYEEDEGLGFDPVETDWREYVNLFTIGQKVPLPDIDTNTFRCMDYRTITDTTSWQYNIQLQSFTNNDSGLRYYEYNGQRYYTVALATAYGIDLGNAYRVELENGTTFNIIHAEYKHDIRYPRKDDYGDKDVNYDGNETCSVIEFIYDWTSAPQTLIDDGEANRYLGEGCDIYGTGCNIKSMTYLGKIWSVN